MVTRLKISFPGKGAWSWIDSQCLSSIGQGDIRQAIVECEMAKAVLTDELRRRSGDSEIDVTQCNVLLAKAKRQLKDDKGSIWCQQEYQLTSHINRLLQPWTQTRNRDHELLWLVSALVSPAHALLIVWPPVTSTRYMNSTQRARLVAFVSERRDELLHPDLLRVATEYGLLAGGRRDAVLVVRPELPTIFAGLRDDDSSDLARLVVFAGGSVPACLLLGACRPTAWGSNGEIEETSSSNLIAVLSSPQRYDEALRNLVQHGIINPYKRMSQQHYSVHPTLVGHIRATTENQAWWKLEVAKAVLHAYPGDGYLDPVFYTSKALSMLSHFDLVLSTIWELEAAILADRSLLRRLAIAALSASHFRSAAWKWICVYLAEASARYLNDASILASVALRKVSLSRLYQSAAKQASSPPTLEGVAEMFGIYDQRSNAWFGKLVMLEVQLMVDNQAPSEDIRDAVGRFRPLDNAKPSTLEQLTLIEGQFLVAKALRFEGKLEESNKSFEALFEEARKTGSRIVWKMMSHICDIKCELGNASEAIGILESDLNTLLGLHAADAGAAKRLRLALANAYLMKALWTWESKKVDLTSLKMARLHFTWLETTYVPVQRSKPGMHNHFVVLAGYAMVLHVEGDLVSAYRMWERALATARSCWADDGYSVVMVLYSKSQIAYQLGYPEAGELAELARTLYFRTGRQYYFTGHGSIWPDIVGSMEEDQGRLRMMPKRGPNLVPASFGSS